MARQLFNTLWPRFKYSAFVTLSDQQTTINQFKGVMRSVLRYMGSSSQPKNMLNLQSELANVVGSNKVLYVLDNISSPDQLQHLLPAGAWGDGSKVIITTRHTCPDAGSSGSPQSGLQVRVTWPHTSTFFWARRVRWCCCSDIPS
jgi:hypothetical protein